ncbi:MAG: M23 family metallopeptidase [Devosiaceae bacterium]|nr:M23 family metallopeptidase [Devosiaceae bacterium MH13]
MVSKASKAHSGFHRSVQAKQGRTKHERRIIFAHGESVQVLRIPPWLGLLFIVFVLAGSAGIIGSASYLFFRDELFTASIKRQHQIQVAYEDRIAELRREIDRITSRQLLNQQAYEARVERLLGEHFALSARSDRLDSLLDQAAGLGLVPREAPPSPIVPPNSAASLGATPFVQSDDDLITGSIPTLPTDRPYAAINRAVSDPSATLISIEEALEVQAYNQRVAIAGLAATTQARVDAISEGLRSVGVRVPLPSAQMPDAPATTELGVGGPLLPAAPGAPSLEREYNDALRAMADLEAVREAVTQVPVAAPTRGARLSSRFGNRRDPFTRRTAFHSGIDYAAPTGHPIYAAADGVVTRARRAGGYGLMIEIDHPNGLTTRYAHLSRMLVAPGARVSAGELIGRMGSTGRSTGPHLHYEVRRGSRAVDPMPFVTAGRALEGL